MKKIHSSPVVRVMTIDTTFSVMAASDSSAQTFQEKVKNYTFEQDGVRDGSSIKGSEILAKPMLWDESVD